MRGSDLDISSTMKTTDVLLGSRRKQESKDGS